MMDQPGTIIKVLLVDDDEEEFILVKDLLKDDKRFELFWAVNGPDALEYLCAKEVQITLINHYLGHQRSTDFLKEQNKTCPGIPVIMIFGAAVHPQTIDEGIQLGITRFIDKRGLRAETLTKAILDVVKM